MIELREALRQYKLQKDLTLPELAKRLKRHPLTVFNFLHGRGTPRPETLYRIQKLLEAK